MNELAIAEIMHSCMDITVSSLGIEQRNVLLRRRNATKGYLHITGESTYQKQKVAATEDELESITQRHLRSQTTLPLLIKETGNQEYWNSRTSIMSHNREVRAACPKLGLVSWLSGSGRARHFSMLTVPHATLKSYLWETRKLERDWLACRYVDRCPFIRII